MYITASLLYNFIQCPHRVWRDIYGPQDERVEEENSFVKLLWEKGVNHEEKIMAKIGEYLDLGKGSLDERFEKTLKALNDGVPLIYQGVIKHHNLLGIPDLLKRLPDGSYITIDIKSGMALEGADEENGDEGKPKKHYAVQLCLYNEVLRNLGFSKSKTGKILDIDGVETLYELDAMMGAKSKTTWWEEYERIKKNVDFLIKNLEKNKPAMKPSVCKLCPWYGSCKRWCEENDDLSLIFYVGRRDRDTLSDNLMVEKIDDLFDLNVEEVMKQKKLEKKNGNKSFLHDIAEKSLQKIIRRGRILTQTKKPIAYDAISFPSVSYELFFDIEDDPTQEFVYLHGIYERSKQGERFMDFTARELTHEAEKEAWQKFWDYIRSLPENDFTVYYFSPHEKTTYKRMQKKFPEVISSEEVEAFFENPNVIDLYGIVQKSTDWPLGSYSLKALAVYLGFKWRDETPSGALSIQWFNEYLEKHDPKILERILLYNEDDCKATMVLKDGLEKLPVVAKD